MATVIATICKELKSFRLLNSKAIIFSEFNGFKPKGLIKLKILKIKKKIKSVNPSIEKKIIFVKAKSLIKNIRRK